MRAGETYTVFDEATRLPVCILTCTPDQLSKNLKAGQIVVPGRFPGTRLNDADEPEPDTDRASEVQTERSRVAAQARTEELERRSIRALREAVLELLPADHSLRSRLQEQEDEIEPLRERMRP
jgi:predicted RNase H-like nuclease (RuvC/YqgF family)